MTKNKYKLFLRILIFSFIVLSIIYITKSKIQRSDVNIISKNGITIKIDNIIMTDDRLAVSIVGSRDDGDYIGAYTWGRGSKWDWYGLDKSVLNNYTNIPSLKTKNIAWCFISPYKAVDKTAYGTFSIKDLAYQDPTNNKWIVSHKGSWKLCFPLNQTDETVVTPINKEIFISNTNINVINLRIDILGITLEINKHLPIKDEFSNDCLKELEVEYKDGTRNILELSQMSKLNIDTKHNNELNYIVSLNSNAPTDEFSIIDIENINDISLNGISLLN